MTDGKAAPGLAELKTELALLQIQIQSGFSSTSVIKGLVESGELLFVVGNIQGPMARANSKPLLGFAMGADEFLRTTEVTGFIPLPRRHD